MNIKFDVPKNLPKLGYGTAGFRMNYSNSKETLSFIVYCVGIISSIISKEKSGKVIGVMLTASHNPKCENGVKIIEPKGDVLSPTWEKECEFLVNVKSQKELQENVHALLKKYNLKGNELSNVYVGYDTRESSLALFEMLKNGLKSLENTTYHSYGLVTTPQLHYLVYYINGNRNKYKNICELSVNVYYKKMITNFQNLLFINDDDDHKDKDSGKKKKKKKKKISLYLDTACAIGSIAMNEMIMMCSDFIDLNMINDGEKYPQFLNDECGADYVNTKKKYPRNYKESKNLKGKGIGCFDGDADRLILFYQKDLKKMELQRSFVAIKPDGVQRGLIGNIIKKYEKRGFKIIAMKYLQAPKSVVEKHYEEHKGKKFFSGLVEYLCSGPIVILIIEGKNCINVIRKMNGVTNPLNALPGTIRGDYGIEVGRNLIHASDSRSSARREISLWFNETDESIWNKTVDEKWLHEEEKESDMKDQFNLLNGDKISALFTKFISDVLKVIEFDYTLAVIQTAYANGSSSMYLESVLPNGKKNLFCVATGVKHLHHKAKEFDVGIYFENNGHGTVIFSDKMKKLTSMENIEKFKNDKIKYKALLKLHYFINLINQAVGDAISDYLACVAILHLYHMDYHDWNEFYTDLPSILDKMKVKDRTMIKTTKDETKVIEPKGMQKEIDEALQKVNDENARTFVRPSGTEDYVRIYVESSKMENNKVLLEDVKKIVKKFC